MWVIKRKGVASKMIDATPIRRGYLCAIDRAFPLKSRLRKVDHYPRLCLLYEFRCGIETGWRLTLLWCGDRAFAPWRDEHQTGTDETSVEGPSCHLLDGGEGGLHLHLAFHRHRCHRLCLCLTLTLHHHTALGLLIGD